ncbi:TasA family protein [Virgibacillus ainsalahensis]
MSIRKKLIMSVALAAFGISLITGGTSAYFADTASTDNSITTGSLDLGLNKETIFQMEGLIPGDTQESEFTLTNDGNVDMKEITLNTTYEVVDQGGPNNDDDLGNHILVELFSHQDGNQTLVFEKTLAELSGNSEQIGEEIPSGDMEKHFTAHLTFIDNGENQNHFQTDELQLNWEFEAVQQSGNTDAE